MQHTAAQVKMQYHDAVVGAETRNSSAATQGNTGVVEYEQRFSVKSRVSIIYYSLKKWEIFVTQSS